MHSLIILPSSLQGSTSPPPSKSLSIRAIVFACMAKGSSTLYNLLPSPDIEAALSAASALGADVIRDQEKVVIHGIAGKIKLQNKHIHVGNSGQVLRFFGALAALGESPCTFTGDESICKRRVVKPLLEAICQLRGKAYSIQQNDYAPMMIQGPIQPGIAQFSGEDSQPVSAMLMACAFLRGTTQLTINNPGETPWVDMTLSWLNRFGIQCHHSKYKTYKIVGSASYDGFSYTIPTDWSAAAFPIAAALTTQSTLKIKNLDFSPVQGDQKLIPFLQRMGAKFHQDNTSLEVLGETPLQGTEIQVNNCIDALPTLAVLGCFANGKTKITGARIARSKESDRISAICTELQKMGAKIQEEEDGLTIEKSNLCGTKLESHSDHRIAMALTVAALGAKGQTEIMGTNCIQKSYPHFCTDFKNIRANIEERV